MRSKALSRRTFLRGAGGVAIGLPLLDVMLDANGTALADGGAIPNRYCLGFGGYSLGIDDQAGSVAYTPDTVGPGYDIKAAAAPLTDVKDDVTFVSGLSIPKDDIGSVQPGGRHGVHNHGNPLFAGLAQLGNSQFDAQNHVVTGPTSDQVVAEAIAAGTTFRSLEYRVQAVVYAINNSAGHQNQGIMSFRDDGAGTIVPMPPVVSPKLAYDTLFTGFAPTDPAQAAAAAFDLEKRKSVLDVVDRRIGGVLPTLGAADRQRMERHYDEIRALEQLLEAVPPDGVGGCGLPPDPGADPALGGDNDGKGPNYDINAGYSDEDTRARIFCDLIHMAFTCDLSRVATLMMTFIGSTMNAYQIADEPWSVHEVSHQSDLSGLGGVVTWHLKHYAYLVRKLRDTPEGAGSVLDNCALLYANECGWGFDSGYGNYSSHVTDNMVVLVAGRAGGLRAGEHIIAPAGANHPANVCISAMRAVGVATDRLGDISGTIPALTA